MPQWDHGFHADLQRRLRAEHFDHHPDAERIAALERMIEMQEKARDGELATLNFGTTAWWVQTTAVEELRERLLRAGG